MKIKLPVKNLLLSVLVIHLLILVFLPCTLASAGFIVTESQEFTLTGETKCIFPGDCKESTIEVPLFLNKFDSGFAPYLEIKTLAIKPEPTEIKVDANGNMRAVYKNFHATGDLTVSQIALVESRSVKLLPAKPYSNAVDSLYKKYLAPSDLIESRHLEIIKKAAQLTKGIKDPYDKARKIYSFVQQHMTYDEREKYRNKGALSALRTGRGVCEDHSALMAALLRASGIPARLVGGYAFDYAKMSHVANGQRYILPDGSRWMERDDGHGVTGSSRHGWLEFYLKGEGWVPADPTTTVGTGRIYPDWSTFGALNSAWNYIPDSVGSTFSTSYRVDAEEPPAIAGMVKVKKGYQDVGEGYFLVMSRAGGGKFSVPFFLPYRTVSISINGEAWDVSPPPVIKSGTTLVPARGVFEALGGKVVYNRKKKRVEIFNEDTSVILPTGNKTAYLNGRPVTLEAAPEIIGGTLYVPVRFAAQALGAEVSWDSGEKQVKLQF
ncbi:MAG: stalk domain-containing protein [Bacillota bacterium]